MSHPDFLLGCEKTLSGMHVLAVAGKKVPYCRDCGQTIAEIDVMRAMAYIRKSRKEIADMKKKRLPNFGAKNG